jgi:hypothetical protein
MRLAHSFSSVASLCCLLVAGLGTAHAQMNMGPETARAIPDGGIKVAGWAGKVDANAEKAGQGVKDARFAAEGKGFKVTTGPATTYWNPANVAKGDYTVSATFNEPKYMNLNDHPHPYGIVIAGNDLGTDQQSYIYCAPYGNGTFIVRGMGPAAFNLNGRGEPSAAVHKAEGPGTPVTQVVSMSVKGSSVSCSINGTQVWTADKSALVVAGKLKSTDGVYGIRFAHNTEAIVTDLKITK